VRGRERLAMVAGIAEAMLLLSIGPFNAIRDATSNAMFADVES
jgi:hypothetical protein